MLKLSIALFGSLQVTLNGAALTHFVYDKVWALFVYLVIESHQSHRRETLAALLWEDFPEERARSNLRQTLNKLRYILGDRQAASPFLLTTRQTIQFNPDSNYSLDVATFLTLLGKAALDPQRATEFSQQQISNLEHAIALYQGAFLAEIKTFESEAFVEWLFLTREKLHRQAVDACASLITYYEHHRHWQQTQRYAQRLLELEPWHELAHQVLMRVYAYCGQCSLALQQYKKCCQILESQFETEPDCTTTAVYEQIRDRSLPLIAPPNQLDDPAISNLSEVESFQSSSEETIVKIPSNQTAIETGMTDKTADLADAAIVKMPSNQAEVKIEATDLVQSAIVKTPLDQAEFDQAEGKVKLGSEVDLNGLAIVKISSNQTAIETESIKPEQTRFSQTAIDPNHQRNRCKMLEKVHTFWIKGVLENSLYDAVMMDLGLEECPDAVAQPWNLLMQFADRPQQTLPIGTPIIDVYDRLNRSLLILGAPGAGKTTLLLELTRSLLLRAEQNPEQPIPVVFNLSSWAANPCPLANWLIDELQLRYQVPPQWAQAWIESAQLLPLLDGLDEVALPQRSACVAAINQFCTSYWLTDLVVCSRTTDYQGLPQHLQLHGAIVVQPLTLAQIDSYFKQLGAELSVARTVLQQDSVLQELATTPLMANIIALAVRGQSPDELPAQSSSQIWRDQLFATYLQRMLVHRGAHPGYDAAQVMQWLTWLARTLAQRGQTLFLIERLQPDCLSSAGQRRWLMTIETILVALLMGIAGGIGVGLHRGLAVGWAEGILPWLNHGLQGMIQGLGVGLMTGISTGFLINLITLIAIWLYSFRKDITLPQLKSWKTVGYAIRIGLAAGLSQGWAVASFLGPRLGIGAIAIIAGCTAIAVWRFLEPDRVVLLEVWRWSWSRARRGAVVSIVFGSIFTLVYAMGYGWVYGWVMGLVVGLIGAIGSGFTSGEIETKIAPNQGIRRSLGGALRMSLAIGIPFGLANGIGYGLTLDWPGGIGKGVSSAIESGVACWLICGGLACLQHLVIRYFLYRQGAMPWNYAAFLDYATDRTFLRPVGGSYMFIHRLLLEYLATPEPVLRVSGNQTLQPGEKHTLGESELSEE
jgi:DNA-binding SARP family transcriptional activator